MRRAISAALFAAWAGAGMAVTVPHVDPERARLTWAGRHGDILVLAALIEARDATGLQTYRSAFASPSAVHSGMEKILPLVIEPLIVRHFRDPVIGTELRWLAEAASHGSQELFDVILVAAREQLAAGRTAPLSPSPVAALVRTRRLGVEATIDGLLVEQCADPFGSPRQLDLQLECRVIALFLANRQYEPAREQFESRVTARQPGTAGDDVSVSAISMYKDRRAMDFLLLRFEALATAPVTAESVKEAEQVVAGMGRVGAGIPVDLARLHRAASAFPRTRVTRRVVDLVAPRNDPAGIPILVDALGGGPGSLEAPRYAIRAIEAMESAPAWQLARDKLRELERAGPLEPELAGALPGLDERLVDPERTLADMRQKREKRLAEDAAWKKGREPQRVADARSPAAGNSDQAAKALRRVDAAAPSVGPDEARVAKAGREGDVAVFRALVEARDAAGLQAYRLAFAPYSSTAPAVEKMLPAEIEPLIARHFRDPGIGTDLRWLAESATHGSQELFDVVLAAAREQMATGRMVARSPSPVAALLKTRRPGAEAPIFALLAEQCADPLGTQRERDLYYVCREIVYFVAGRRYEPAREWFEARVAARRPGTRGDDLALRGAASYRDRRAMDFLLARFEALAAAPVTVESVKEAEDVVVTMGLFGADIPLDLARVHRAGMAFPRTRVTRRLADLAALRNDPAGIPILVDALDAGPDSLKAHRYAIRAIESMESEQAWRQARDKMHDLERAGRLDPELAGEIRRLDQRLVDPERTLADMRRGREERLAEGAAGKKRDERQVLATEARRLAAVNPDEAAKAYRRYVEATIADLEGAGTRPGTHDTLRDLEVVAAEAVRLERYVRRDPRAAVELLQRLARTFDLAPAQSQSPFVHWQIADILHFDLRDGAAAAKEMQKEAARQRARQSATAGAEGELLEGIAEWMEAEAAFLHAGAVPRGRPTEAMRGGVTIMLGDGTGLGWLPAMRAMSPKGSVAASLQSAADRAKALAALEGLSPSRANLFGILDGIGLFPDEASLRRYLDKHDPAGAVSLVLLDFLVRLDRDSVCPGAKGGELIVGFCNDRSREAARRILASRGHPGPAAPDARFATPEGAWSVFIAALRAGDRDTALACMTPALRARRRESLKSMDAATMRAMAEAYSPLTMRASIDGFQEAYVTRDRGGRKQAFMIYFQQTGREWRISEM